MKKLFKLFIASTMMISAFLFGAFIFTTHAEKPTAEPSVETPTTEVVETKPTTVIEQETKPTEKQTEFLNWITSNFETVKVLVGAFMAKCGIDTLTLIALLVVYLKSKVKKAADDEKYKKFKEELDAEHKKEIENLEKGFNEKLDKIYEIVIDTIKKQNSEKREIAKNNVDEMRAALCEIKVNLDE